MRITLQPSSRSWTATTPRPSKTLHWYSFLCWRWLWCWLWRWLWCSGTAHFRPPGRGTCSTWLRIRKRTIRQSKQLHISSQWPSRRKHLPGLCSSHSRLCKCSVQLSSLCKRSVQLSSSNRSLSRRRRIHQLSSRYFSQRGCITEHTRSRRHRRGSSHRRRRRRHHYGSHRRRHRHGSTRRRRRRHRSSSCSGRCCPRSRPALRAFLNIRLSRCGAALISSPCVRFSCMQHALCFLVATVCDTLSSEAANLYNHLWHLAPLTCGFISPLYVGTTYPSYIYKHNSLRHCPDVPAGNYVNSF